MATKKVLTDAAIKKMKAPTEGQVEHFDAALPGFAVRVSSRGTKSFVFFYRIRGRQRRKTFKPRYPLLSLAEAREQACEILRLIEQGEDPGKRELEVPRFDPADDTYADAVEDFIQKWSIAKKQNRRWKDQRALLLNANPLWHHRPVSEITRAEIYHALDSRMSAGKPYMANRIYEVLRTFYRWLYSRDRVPENIMEKVQKPFDGESPRQRAWSGKELKAIWKATDQLEGLWPAYVRLLVLLGQRRNELAGMRWSELDLKNAVWILPAERHKGKRGQKYPLPALAVRILKGMPKIKGNDFVFPGRRDDKPMVVGSKAQKRIQQASGVEDFSYRDARHTFRTGLDELKIAPHIKSEALGHARQGVGDVHYSHYDYLDEMREAFEAWANHVERLVYPKGVVGLHG